MALGAAEHRDAWAVRHVHGSCHPAPTETLDPAQRCLEVPDLHVERDVALASFGGGADAVVDAALYAGVPSRSLDPKATSASQRRPCRCPGGPRQ